MVISERQGVRKKKSYIITDKAITSTQGKLKEGARLNDGKPDLSYCHLGYEVSCGEARVWEKNDKVNGGKYDRGNWLIGMAWVSCIASMSRHLARFTCGQDLDVPWGWVDGDPMYDTEKYSGLPHVDCLVCCAKILSNSYHTRKDLDNRKGLV